MAEQYINMDNLAVGYNGKALIHAALPDEPIVI